MSVASISYKVTKEAIAKSSIQEEYMKVVFLTHFNDLLKEVQFKNWEILEVTLSVTTD